MNLFAYRTFEDEIIIWAVRWYTRYGISYRELQEMMQERNVKVDHTTLNRWVIAYGEKFGRAVDHFIIR